MQALSRRDILKGSALVVSFSLARPSYPQATAARSLDPSEIDSFLAIHRDGSVTLYTSKVDVGTGMRIAIPQMAAEELGIPVERITLVEGDTGLTADTGGTGGSTGLTRGGTEIRQAAATARMAILNLAAERLQRPASELQISGGRIVPGTLTVGELVGDRALHLKTDPKAPLRKPAEYTVVGKPIPRPDVPGKCTGRAVYLQDVTVPGMLHGRVVRPPAIGAKLQSVDEASIRHIPDVRVVRIESFLGVVAKDEWAAIRAARELKASWSEWKGLPGSENLEQHIRQSPIDKDQPLVSRGDAKTALPAAATQLSATYWWPFQSHASLAPCCAVADVRADGATVWTSTQSPHGLRNSLVKVFGMPAGKTRVIFLPGAGSYGGNGNDDTAADAVLLSKAVGQPVRVQWMRHDEHGWDPKGPAQLLDVKGGLDAGGRLVAWETQMWLPTSVPGNRAIIAADLAGIPQGHGQGAGAISQNADPPYAVPHLSVVTHWVRQSPLRLSNLRAPGKIGNAFAVESFTDELAAAARVDPVEFRLRGLTDPRALAVIQRAAQMMEWQPRPSPNPQAGSGRGIAYVRYKQSENYVAIAMEVAVDRTTGRISIRRVACAHDCGLVVNPDALRNQIEGSILQTLSRTLHEEVKFDNSRVTTVDWASYPILTFPEAPAIEVALLSHPDQPLLGAGEAATAPVAAALGNAIFDATGKRLRRVPFRAVV
ncbi:MAG TPA: molybdopterin cofactor-binding domain-containing protein [Bryobacteraceae bacterium]|nr:molybdopterin cofactor-binding domain-containing protein [Bryobacteraceae bacterium]